MNQRRAPFYLRRTKEAMVYFPERRPDGTWVAEKIFTKRVPHTVDFQIDGAEFDLYRDVTRFVADAFKRAGIVERIGRGIDTIFYEQLRNGRPAPSYERSNETGVVLVLPGGSANLEFVRLITEETQAGRQLRLDELLILNRLWSERHLTTVEGIKLIQKSEFEARSVLERLVEAGLIESRGERKGRSYHLSATTYRRMGEKAAYVRQRGFEPLQQEQMVIQYLKKHRRISRSETAELCRIGPFQATRLLKKLVKKEKLKMHGTKKGAWYELRS